MMKTSPSSLPTRLMAFASCLGALSNAACVTDDVDPVGGGGTSGGGATAAGGRGGNAGNTSTGGATGGGGAATGIRADPAFGVGTLCYPIAQALMTDFSPVAPAPVGDAGVDGGADAAPPVVNTVGASFGDFTTNFSGSTFIYPGDGAWPVASDTSMSNWHVSGSIGNYSGFGVSFSIAGVGCNLIDASAYRGISFTIRGNIAFTPSTVTFNIGQASNDVSHLWLNTQPTPPVPLAPANFGRCIPASANQFDGTCGAPRSPVTVTETETTVEVLWSQLLLGTPAPMLDPTEITGFSWNFPAPVGAGTPTPTPFQADVYIDNLRFIE